MTKIQAEGNYLILEKFNYEEEKLSEGGIIYKESQVLSSSFAEAKISSMGKGLSDSNGNIPEIDYDVGDVVLYDARSRIGEHKEFDVIKREDVIAVVYEDETG